MSYPVFSVPAGDVLPVMFTSYAGSTGASVTLTGLAVTDIEIYKDGAVTQRASDAGYTLLDTDGIDFDAITGVHGFSIDTGDNTDAGFYTVGAWFTVVVSAVTVDSQTVNFIACQFRLMPAESIAGKPKVDVDAWLGTAAATPTVAGVPEVDLTHVAGATTNVSALATNVDAILVDTGTTLDARIPAALVGGRMDVSVGAMAANVITDAAIAADVTAVIADAVWNGATITYGTAGSYGALVETNLDAAITSRMAAYTQPTGFLAATFPGTVASTTNITAATGITVATNSDKTGYSLTAATGLGDQTANITGNVSGSVGSVTGAVGSVTAGVTVAAGGVGSGAIAAAELNNIADGTLNRVLSAGVDSGADNTTARTVRQALRGVRNRVAVAGGVATVYKEDDVTASHTAAVTTTAGNPVSEVNPT